MRYSFDDHYSVITKNTSCYNNSQISDFSAIDYFQFEFNDVQYHNCWKLIQNTHSSSPFIPQSTNIRRLENIIWRKWAKTKSNLKECNPEKVNWYKESDITWLYGPLADTEKSESNFGFTYDDSFSSKDRRNGSFSSLSSASSIDSTNSFGFDEDSESDLESMNDSAVFIDEEYDLLSVKSILKHRSSNGPLDFEEFRNLTKSTTTSTTITSQSPKSVSFAEMVQIRQFY